MRETIVSLLLLGLLVAINFYEELLMPMSAIPAISIGSVVVFLFFASILWRENGFDEREEVHIQKTGRISFLVGSGILLAGIVYQAFQQNIDPWLVYALIGMILSKLLVRLYYQQKM